jgi:CheY-like chemotaxis protein
LVDELADAAASSPDAQPPSAETGGASDAGDGPTPTERGRVLCIPVRDEADEAAAIMLGQLLQRSRFDVETEATMMQAGELLERVKSHRPDAIILSIVPPLGGRDGRYLCRRVRAAYPDLPIVIGLWNGEDLDTAKQRLAEAGASQVATGLREAVSCVESLAATFPSRLRAGDGP